MSQVTLAPDGVFRTNCFFKKLSCPPQLGNLCLCSIDAGAPHRSYWSFLCWTMCLGLQVELVILTNKVQDSSETRKMSSVCCMTRSRSFSWEMDRQLDRELCSSPQFIGLLIVKRTGQRDTANRTSCRAVCHTQTQWQSDTLHKSPQKLFLP